MSNFSKRIILIGCYLTLATCEPAAYGYHDRNSVLDLGDLDVSDVDGIGQNNNDLMYMDKRGERYGFGLGRRAFTYTSGGSGVKRLPVYNFGLGKRARPYSFGLGKRNDFDNSQNQEFDEKNKLEKLYGLLELYYNTKRNRPYSFGLGKREPLAEEKRRFDFGLGKRTEEERRYNFGIGKREENYENEFDPYKHEEFTGTYNKPQFKRELKIREIPSASNRIVKRNADAPPYDFGMGKRDAII